jgi:hypothetical protein
MEGTEAQAAPVQDSAPAEQPEGQATESVEAQAPAEEAPEASIDDLAAAELDADIFNAKNPHKGINYQQVISELPEDAQKLVANLRADYQRKTSNLSEQRKAIEATRADLEAQRKALLDSDFFQDITATADKELGEFNPYDDKSFEERIQKEVAQRMKSMLEPMRQQQELHNQKIRLQQFKSEHPDLEDIKTDVAKVLMDNKHMNLEQAYWQVKGRILSDKMKTQEAELSSYKKVAREAGLKVGGASRGRTNGIPKHIMDQDDPAAIYNWLKENKGKVKI